MTMRIICDVFRRDQQPETAGIRLAIPTRDGSKFCVVVVRLNSLAMV